MNFTWLVGGRYLRSRRSHSISVITWIAVTGVTLGVAALLCVLSITAGFQREFERKVLGVNAHVLVLKYGLDFEEYEDVVKEARALPSVLGASPFLIHEMMLAKGRKLAGVLVKGIDPARTGDVLDLPRQIVSGSLADLGRRVTRNDNAQPSATDTDAHPDDAPRSNARPTVRRGPAAAAQAGPDLLNDDEEAALFQAIDRTSATKEPADDPLPRVVVGVTLAERLGLGIGDHVQIVSPLTGLDTAIWSTDISIPQTREFVVAAIFRAGFHEYDSNLVYIDLHEAQSFFDRGSNVTGVEIRVRDIEQAPRIAKTLERKLGGTPYHTLDWRELNHNLFTALEIQKIMLSLVIATIIFVAAFNVIATLIMVVLERRREISILKVMGARRRSITSIFAIQGVTVGVIGTLAGLIIGGLICAYLSIYRFPLDPKVYLIDHLPLDVTVGRFLLTAGVAFAICATATLLPSWWAAKLRPADGLRSA